MRVFRHTVSHGARTGMLVDLIMCFAAVLLAASTITSRYATVPRFVPEVPLIMFGATLFALVMALMYAFLGLYRPVPLRAWANAGRTLTALAVGGYVTSLALRAVADRGYVEQLLAATVAYLAVGLVAVRCALGVMVRASPLSRVLIVGTGPEALTIAKDLKGPGRTARNVVGLYPTSEAPVPESSGQYVFSRETSITDLVAWYDIQEIIVAVHEQRGGSVPMDQLLACRIRGIPVLDLAGFCERTKSEVPIDSLKSSWLVYGHGFVQGPWRTFVKRLFDIISSFILLSLLSPVMFAAMIAVRLDSPGPAIHWSLRVGRGNRTFAMPKFRTMRTDTPDAATHLLKNPGRWITPLGRFLRRASLDELPQLWSVFAGDMSLVGPRPALHSQADLIGLRTEVGVERLRPGVTGWAQVNGRDELPIPEKVRLDREYLERMSFAFDLRIIAATALAAVTGRGVSH